MPTDFFRISITSCCSETRLRRARISDSNSRARLASRFCPGLPGRGGRFRRLQPASQRVDADPQLRCHFPAGPALLCYQTDCSFFEFFIVSWRRHAFFLSHLFSTFPFHYIDSFSVFQDGKGIKLFHFGKARRVGKFLSSVQCCVPYWFIGR